MNDWIPILTYHRICDVPRAGDPLRLCTHPRDLERLLRYLGDRGYSFVSLKTALEILRLGRGKERCVCLTFDDGYHDFYENAFPLLKRYDACATVFLVADYVGETNRWDDVYLLPPVPLLGEGEIRELQSEGVEFGSHGRTHRRLTFLSAREQQEETAGSRRRLEALLDRPVRFFAYPHLAQDLQTRKSVREAGYLAACGGEQASHQQFLLHRVNVAQSSWPATLFRLWGWRHLLQRNNRLRTLKRFVPQRRRPVELAEVQR
jgi:peptidoglycan/xylan/chitin deacetylase (PgdA/CDA1 family)